MRYSLFNKIIRYTKKMGKENIKKAISFIKKDDLSGFLNFCCQNKCFMPAASHYLENDLYLRENVIDIEKMLLLCEAVGIPVAYPVKTR